MNCLIPAHGYSRRVERKHTRPFYKGLSLTEWSVIQATCSSLIGGCYVSTDDDEVAAQTELRGGKVIWRDYEQTPDDSAGVPVYHALKKHPELFAPGCAQLLVTSPIRPPDLIDRVIGAWLANPSDSYTAIGKQEETMLCMKTNAGYFQPFCDKRGPWTGYTHSTHVIRYSRYVEGHEYSLSIGADKDSVVNAEKTNNVDYHQVRPQPFIEVPWWQCVEPDTPEDFPVCAALMEYMMGGMGPEVYYEYYVRGKE